MRALGWSIVALGNGVDAGTVSATEITLPTAKGEVLTLGPDGVSYADIGSRL
jgi:hypothetical protein